MNVEMAGLRRDKSMILETKEVKYGSVTEGEMCYTEKCLHRQE